jgi:hypothetical protein
MALKQMIQAIAELPNGVLRWRSYWTGEPGTVPSPDKQPRAMARRRRQILRGQLRIANGLEPGLDTLATARNLEQPQVVLVNDGKPQAGLLDRILKKAS